MVSTIGNMAPLEWQPSPNMNWQDGIKSLRSDPIQFRTVESSDIEYRRELVFDSGDSNGQSSDDKFVQDMSSMMPSDRDDTLSKLLSTAGASSNGRGGWAKSVKMWPVGDSPGRISAGCSLDSMVALTGIITDNTREAKIADEIIDMLPDSMRRMNSIDRSAGVAQSNSAGKDEVWWWQDEWGRLGMMDDFLNFHVQKDCRKVRSHGEKDARACEETHPVWNSAQGIQQYDRKNARLRGRWGNIEVKYLSQSADEPLRLRRGWSPKMKMAAQKEVETNRGGLVTTLLDVTVSVRVEKFNYRTSQKNTWPTFERWFC